MRTQKPHCGLQFTSKTFLPRKATVEFIVSAAASFELRHTGNASVGADPFTSITTKVFFGKGFSDVPCDWLRPFAVTGEMDYTWSTHPIDVTGWTLTPAWS